VLEVATICVQAGSSLVLELLRNAGLGREWDTLYIVKTFNFSKKLMNYLALDKINKYNDKNDSDKSEHNHLLANITTTTPSHVTCRI
jgi:hypothetical protein